MTVRVAAAPSPAQTISAERAASFVKSGMWLDYGEPMGHVGFVVARADRRRPLNSLQPKPSEFVMVE